MSNTKRIFAAVALVFTLFSMTFLGSCRRISREQQEATQMERFRHSAVFAVEQHPMHGYVVECNPTADPVMVQVIWKESERGVFLQHLASRQFKVGEAVVLRQMFYYQSGAGTRDGSMFILEQEIGEESATIQRVPR